MDVYTILSILIFVAVIAVIVAVVWRYQRVRAKTGYNTGKVFVYKQQMGAYIGNDHMDRIGGKEANAGNEVENDEEVFVFSDTDKGKD